MQCLLKCGTYLTTFLYWPRNEAGRWVVKIDLDYICAGKIYIIVSDEYLRQVGKQSHHSIDAARVGVVTLCLTPDSYTPGWEEPERIAALLLAELGTPFRLPS